MEKITLAPCPVCGEPPKTRNKINLFGYWYVECDDNKDGHMVSVAGTDRKSAQQNWQDAMKDE